MRKYADIQLQQMHRSRQDIGLQPSELQVIVRETGFRFQYERGNVVKSWSHTHVGVKIATVVNTPIC